MAPTAPTGRFRSSGARMTDMLIAAALAMMSATLLLLVLMGGGAATLRRLSRLANRPRHRATDTDNADGRAAGGRP